MHSISGIRFSRRELAQLLGIPEASVDPLFATMPSIESASGEVSVSAADVESLLRESIIRLYRAVAQANGNAEAAPENEVVLEAVVIEEVAPPVLTTVPEEASVITRSIAEFEAPAASERADLRIAPRYTPRRQIGGNFQQVRFTVLQLSTTGLRIRHDEPLRPGDEARLTFAVQKPARSFALKARVVWTSTAQRGDQQPFYVSGLTVIDREDQLHAAIDLLRDARELEIETVKSRRPHGGGAPAALTGMNDEDVAAIIRTLRKLNADPVEASRWYARARFSIADEEVRRAAPQRARDREEVLGIWEYLDRRIDVASIAKVVAWIRQTRAAAAQ